MDKLFDLIRPFLDGVPVWISVAIGVGFILIPWWLMREWKLVGSADNPSIETRIEWLENETIPGSYQQGLNKLLDLIEGWFGKATPTKTSGWMNQWLGIQPWTSLAFERLMLLAVIYPMLFLTLGWLFGNVGQMGELVVLEPTSNGLRVLAVFLLGFMIFSFYKLDQVSGFRSLLWLAFFAVAVAGARAVAFAGAGAVAFAVAFAGAGVVAGAVAGAIAGVVAFAFALAFEHFRDRLNASSRLALFWLLGWIFLLLYLGATSFAIVNWGSPEKFKESLSILLFMGVLPLFNAPLDWLSFGFTRGLLHSIATQKHGWERILITGMVDVVIALIFLLLVAGSSLFALILVNWVVSIAGAEPVIDLPSLWKQLHEGNWQQNLWIWLMLGSTLIPTAIHFLVALFALAVVLPHVPAKAAAVKLKEAREDFLKRDKKNSGYASTTIQIGEDERRIAFVYVVMRQLVVVVFWCGLMWLSWFFIFSNLPNWLEASIALLGQLMMK